MKKILLKNSDYYLRFINQYKEQIKIYKLIFHKDKTITIFYDIM